MKRRSPGDRPPDASQVELAPGRLRRMMRVRRRQAPSRFTLAFGRFRRDRIARASGVALAMLVMAAIFADLWASDLPIVCRVHGVVYVLPNVVRAPALDGYDNDRLEATRAPGDWAILPLVRYGPTGTSTRGQVAPLLAPSLTSGHPLGTDAFGRDVLARLVHGGRAALFGAVSAALAFVALGTVLGGIAGFFGGMFDWLVARAIEALTAFPTLIVVVAVQAVVERPSLTSLLMAIGFLRWPEVARLVRAEVLLASSQDYVASARALGASSFRILRRHVLPNVFTPILVAVTFGVASVVLVEASIDFLRVGTAPGAASWGEMLSETREHPEAIGLLAFPGLLLFVTVMALNLVGEALRDALDPRLRAALSGLFEPTDRAPGAASGGGPGAGQSTVSGRGAAEELPPSTSVLDERPHA